MTPSLSRLWPALERIAHEEGVLKIGASNLADLHADVFAGWIARGEGADMAYLAKNVAVRARPEERYPWARSVISILVPYSPRRPEAQEGAISNHVARYALGDDYHDVLDRILRRLEEEIGRATSQTARTWRYVDTGPLSDRAYATQAGLGWIAKNSMLISEQHGSYFFIGTLVTSLENDITPESVADRCGTCTRCIDACPTDAIRPDRTVSSPLCISYATIEHRGPLVPHVAEHLEGNVFGCDICQEVCPWNSRAPESHPAFAPREAYRMTPVTDLLRFEQAEFSALFRRSAIKRAKLAGVKRNLEAIALAASLAPDDAQ
ncbi:MAG: tRNA epoxyqueuosine(34) reductase QueG [Thermoanaerobaculia bacterium]